MRWLISFQYKAWFSPHNGRLQGGHPVDYITLIETHPAVFAAEMAFAHKAWLGKEDYSPDERSDELVKIYCAIVVDDNLTEEQINALS